MVSEIPNHSIAVQFKNVTKTASNGDIVTPILDNLTGDVPSGTILTLVGPSGSGKSTLLSLCNLLLTPDSGEVYVEGKEVRNWCVPDLRRHVGLVFQTPTMFPGTVLDNLAMGRKLRGLSLDNPSNYLTNVGLPADLLTRNAQELSGGQKQRVALARVLANEPKILLLDEVTSALDPSSSSEVEEWILEIHRQQKITLLWVTHDLEQAERVGGQTWLLVAGRLVEAADTRQFFAQPSDETTRKFLRGELGGTPEP